MNTSSNTDGTTFFLYNVATGMFLNQGGYWGTSPDLRDVGLPCHLYSYRPTRSGDTGSGGGGDGGGDTDGNGPGGNGNGGGPGGFGTSTAASYSSPAGSTLRTYGSSTGSFPYQIYATVQKAVDESNSYQAFLGYITQTTGEEGYDYDRIMLDCTTGQGLTGVAFVKVSSDESTETDDESTSSSPICYYICLYAGAAEIYDMDISSAVEFSSPEDSVCYLFAQLNSDGTEYEVVAKNTINSDSLEFAQWQIVTLADLVENFNSTEGSFANPVDATFYVSDPNFHRRNLELTEAWDVTHSSTTGGWVLGWEDEVWVSDYLNNTDTASVMASMGFCDDIVGYDGTIWTEGTQRFFCRLYGKYNIANILWPSSSSDSVSVTQTLSTGRAGWYEVSCKGFQYGGATGYLYAKASTTSDDTQNYSTQVQLYSLESTEDWGDGITIGGESDDDEARWGTADISSSDSITARAVLAAGQQLTDLTTYETYEAIGYVYVDNDESDNLVIGVTAVSDGSGLAWVAFDDVRLSYLGNVTEYIVLDETDTALSYSSSETTTDDSSTGSIGLNDQLTNAIAYGEAQKEEGATTISGMSNYTLILSRPLVDGEWNSLVLPVDLTPSQILGAFGTNYRLAQFTGVEVYGDNAQTICFTSVSHNDSLHAGYLYIVKPYSSTLVDVNSDTGISSFVTPRSSSSQITTDYTKSVSQKYYVIPQVSFPESAVTAGSFSEEVENTGISAMSSDGTLYFHGTYIKQTKRVESGSYVVGSITTTTTDDDGNETTGTTYGWYHYIGTNALSIKGFRTWIDTTSSATVNSDGDVTGDDEDVEAGSLLWFSIDGVVDESLGGTTGIDNIPVNTTINPASTDSKTDNRIYSLSGQLIREGNSLDNLAKGIYLRNGKKYIVK